MNVRVLPGAAGVETQESPLADLLSRPMAFSLDAWHAAQSRDETLIRDQVLHGYASKDFVYQFSIQGKPVTGISVVGARELASKYGGIKARIVATVEKRGALFVFRTFSPLTIDTRQLHELGDDDDFYECVMEITDVKSGNSIEVRKKEMRTERTRDGKTYQRPHYDVIAESKAYRNGVLAILPQSVISEFEKKCLAAGNVSHEKTIDQLRDGAMTFAAKHGLSLDRQGLAALTYSELYALGQTAKGDIEAFKSACLAMGLVRESQQQEAPKRGRPPGSKNAPKEPEPPAGEQTAMTDKETGETSAPTHTYAEVAEAINKAKSKDELDIASDMIQFVQDQQQRLELSAEYQKARDAFKDAPF